ncbi:hypothetical protein PoB_006725900 [Plakobranchus ocellatus]|uniref:Uncharacterized protein n=1 Tax=Plakobranchus ocellatus TaxID=259542 RepID=A0AAV4D9D1_9GAST|nr:hypothetical protein PoB_006725900 [Plakobranchus ocellatus]
MLLPSFAKKDHNNTAIKMAFMLITHDKAAILPGTNFHFGPLVQTRDNTLEHATSRQESNTTGMGTVMGIGQRPLDDEEAVVKWL